MEKLIHEAFLARPDHLLQRLEIAIARLVVLTCRERV